ncbi:TPA: preprotein translocase subunit Sec61beta [Candidatus Woesearchaeota archaeon]|nr:preprotein translocase subunit Sec61beta [Candidatus Woesearchaeota archaeon]
MSHDTRISMPSGMGGLMRYFDEYKSKITFKPGHIIILCALIMVLMMVLYSYGAQILGLV